MAQSNAEADDLLSWAVGDKEIGDRVRDLHETFELAKSVRVLKCIQQYQKKCNDATGLESDCCPRSDVHRALSFAQGNITRACS